MPEARVYTMQGDEIEMLQLPDKVFATGVSTHLLWEVVRAEELNIRQGTAYTKSRSKVVGSGSKPWRQKHTGRARSGSIGSPIWRGGGVAHGPRGRHWNISVNRKVRRKALAGILTERLEEGNLRVISELESTGKTREIAEFLKKLGCASRKTVIILGEGEELVQRASRNIPGVQTASARNISVRTLVNAEIVLLSKNALDLLEKRVL